MTEPRCQPLREWRAEQLLTIRELARLAGIASSTVYMIENGRAEPRLGTIRRLATVLALDPLQVSEFRTVIEAASSPRRSV